MEYAIITDSSDQDLVVGISPITKGIIMKVIGRDDEGENVETYSFLNTDQNLQLIQALETAQKELDPTYQTRAEIQAERDALLEDANRANQ